MLLFERERRLYHLLSWDLMPMKLLCSREQAWWAGNFQSVSRPSCQLVVQGMVSYFGRWRCQCCLKAGSSPSLRSRGTGLVEKWSFSIIYTGLRNAACPVIIKHLTFYLFIWLAELAFLAFLVGLCCCFFCLWNIFFPLKEARPPCRNINSLQETKQPMVNFPKPSLLCAPSASLQNLCKTESCLV